MQRSAQQAACPARTWHCHETHRAPGATDQHLQPAFRRQGPVCQAHIRHLHELPPPDIHRARPCLWAGTFLRSIFRSDVFMRTACEAARARRAWDRWQMQPVRSCGQVSRALSAPDGAVAAPTTPKDARATTRSSAVQHRIALAHTGRGGAAWEPSVVSVPSKTRIKRSGSLRPPCRTVAPCAVRPLLHACMHMRIISMHD